MECWRKKRCRVYRECGEDTEMIWWRAVEGRERDGASEQSELEVMTKPRMWCLLWVGKLTSWVRLKEKRRERNWDVRWGGPQVVRRIMEVNVKVASDDEFMRGGSSEREEGMEVLKKNRVWFRKWRWRRRSVNVIDRNFGTRKLEGYRRWFEGR